MTRVISFAPLFEGCLFASHHELDAEAISKPGSSVRILFLPVGKLKRPVGKVNRVVRLSKYPAQPRPNRSKSGHLRSDAESKKCTSERGYRARKKLSRRVSVYFSTYWYVLDRFFKACKDFSCSAMVSFDFLITSFKATVLRSSESVIWRDFSNWMRSNSFSVSNLSIFSAFLSDTVFTKKLMATITTPSMQIRTVWNFIVER